MAELLNSTKFSQLISILNLQASFQFHPTWQEFGERNFWLLLGTSQKNAHLILLSLRLS